MGHVEIYILTYQKSPGDPPGVGGPSLFLDSQETTRPAGQRGLHTECRRAGEVAVVTAWYCMYVHIALSPSVLAAGWVVGWVGLDAPLPRLAQGQARNGTRGTLALHFYPSGLRAGSLMIGDV